MYLDFLVPIYLSWSTFLVRVFLVRASIYVWLYKTVPYRRPASCGDLACPPDLYLTLSAYPAVTATDCAQPLVAYRNWRWGQYDSGGTETEAYWMGQPIKNKLVRARVSDATILGRTMRFGSFFFVTRGPAIPCPVRSKTFFSSSSVRPKFLGAENARYIGIVAFLLSSNVHSMVTRLVAHGFKFIYRATRSGIQGEG